MVCLKDKQVGIFYVFKNFIAYKPRIGYYCSPVPVLLKGISHRFGRIVGYIKGHYSDVAHVKGFPSRYRHEQGPGQIRISLN